MFFNNKYEWFLFYIIIVQAGPVIVPEKILSGISAEMAGYRSSSEDEDEKEIDVQHHKFTQPDHVQMLLKSEALKLVCH